jgi:AcrR family transcriptional regulator
MDVDPVKRDPSRTRLTLRAERAGVTRRRIATAARHLFSRDGYGATTLKGVAAEAGVAVQTVYAVYGSKAGILRTLREDVVSQPEAEASFRDAMREASAPRSLDLFARSIRQRWELAGDIVAIHRDASMSDPSVRAEVDAVLGVRRNGIAAFVRILEGRLGPGLGALRAIAIIDALTLPEVFVELVSVEGWTADEYEAWLGALLRRELLGSQVPSPGA